MVEWADLGDLRKGDNGPTPGRINCFKCVYFRISWDSQFPRACEFFGFSGPELPSVTVLKTTGHPCPVFKPKVKPNPQGGQ